MRCIVLLLSLFVGSSSMAKTETAIFAGGCFWCLEADFDKVPGVLETISGYDGGQSKHPTYAQVSAGGTGHAESVKVVFDSDQISYKQLVNYFFHHIDPTVKNRQFCDIGSQYRSAIFYLNHQQRQVAQEAARALKTQLGVVWTEIAPSTQFYPAEAGHQNYYQKNPIRYQYYRYRCGRDKRVEEVYHHAAS